MRIEAAGASDIGRSRENNEDSFVVDEGLGLYGVCDGMGGHAAGEVAAAVALEAVTRFVRHRPWVLRGESGSSDALSRLLVRAVSSANADVFALASERPQYREMGCTLTMLLVSAKSIALASVGDSRFYRVRDGEVVQLTVDHTLGEEMRATGALTPEQIASHRYARLLSRAVGIRDSVRADVFGVVLEPGDRFVACTDGLSDYLETPQSLAEHVREGSASEIAERLVAFANRAGGRDNVTAVVGIVRE